MRGNPMAERWSWLRDHELVHADRMRTFLKLLREALFLVAFPLPTGYSGRWFIERWAFLKDIENGKRTPDEAAATLHRDYFNPWPLKAMKKWFWKQTDG